MCGFKNFKGSDARCPSINFLFYGLSKNQQRVVRSQAKNYVFDDTSKLIYYVLTFVMFVMLLLNVLDD